MMMLPLYSTHSSSVTLATTNLLYVSIFTNVIYVLYKSYIHKCYINGIMHCVSYWVSLCFTQYGLPLPGLHSVLTATGPAPWHVSVVTTPLQRGLLGQPLQTVCCPPSLLSLNPGLRKLRMYHLACLVVILFVCLCICLWSHPDIRASLIAQLEKNLPAMQETLVQFLGWADPLEKGKAIHSSILAWRIPWTL